MKFASYRSGRHFKETEWTIVTDDLFRNAARTANSITFFAKEELTQCMMLVRPFEDWRDLSLRFG